MTDENIDMATMRCRHCDARARFDGTCDHDPKCDRPPTAREEAEMAAANAGFEIGDSAFPMGEMAAGLIHELGTSGIEYPDLTVMEEQERAVFREAMDDESDRDHCGYVENEPVDVEDPLTDLRAAMQVRDERDAAQHALTIAAQQRDILSRQVDSLVQRLAGLHVAHGTMDMAAAQGFVQKEILPINQVLQQIAASQQET